MGKGKYGGKKKTPLSTWDVLKREKKQGGGWISTWTGLSGVASVSFGNQDEMARHLYRHKVDICLKKKACLLFNVKLDTVQKDNIMCLLGEASVTSQKSREKPENGAVEWTKASASLQKQSTC